MADAIPSTAQSNGGINASTPAEQRKPAEVPEDKRKLNKGPKLDEDTGAYQPAMYKTSRGNVRVDR